MIEIIDILTVIGGVMLAMIGYFLKRTMDELKEVKNVAYNNKNKIGIIENDYLNKINALNDKFDLLADNIKELTREIKNLNNKIK